MDRLFRLSSSGSGPFIGLWDCQRCAAAHDAIDSWVLVGVGPSGRGAEILCPRCAESLSSWDGGTPSTAGERS